MVDFSLVLLVVAVLKRRLNGLLKLFVGVESEGRLMAPLLPIPQDSSSSIQQLELSKNAAEHESETEVWVRVL